MLLDKLKLELEARYSSTFTNYLEKIDALLGNYDLTKHKSFLNMTSLTVEQISIFLLDFQKEIKGTDLEAKIGEYLELACKCIKDNQETKEVKEEPKQEVKKTTKVAKKSEESKKSEDKEADEEKLDESEEELPKNLGGKKKTKKAKTPEEEHSDELKDNAKKAVGSEDEQEWFQSEKNFESIPYEHGYSEYIDGRESLIKRVSEAVLSEKVTPQEVLIWILTYDNELLPEAKPNFDEVHLAILCNNFGIPVKIKANEVIVDASDYDLRKIGKKLSKLIQDYAHWRQTNDSKQNTFSDYNDYCNRAKYAILHWLMEHSEGIK